MSTTMLRRALMSSLAVVVLSAACGDDDDETRIDRLTDQTTTTSPPDDATTTTTTTSPPDDATTTTTTTTTTTGGGGDDVDAATSLEVEVTSDGQPLRSGSLTCGATATGTGYFADPAVAEDACALLRDNAGARRRLIEGPDPDLLCTENYGGPEVARVRGQIDGQPVDATVDRTNGCAIADWNMLTALFGPPDT